MRRIATMVVLAAVAAAGGCRHRDGAAAGNGVAPAAPRLIEPHSGALLGAAGGADGARPELRWTAVDGPPSITYRVEVDDSCTPGRVEDCGFPSPEARATVSGTRWRPERPLPVAAQPPLGRRYYLRVRACAGDACSPWSRIRYADVGRTAGDLDGDGFSDVVVGAPLIDNGGVDQGSVFVYYGNRAGIGRQSRVDDPTDSDGSSFGVAVAMAGDVDADGYADVLVGAAGSQEARGLAWLLFGGRAGLGQRVQAIRLDSSLVDDWFGAAVAGAGDVDGDGFADVLVGASGARGQGEDWGVAYLYRGGPAGVRDEPPARLGLPWASDWDHFGFAVVGAGDVDGDGFDDVAVGSPGIDVAGQQRGTDRGAVFLFRGSSIGIVERASARLEAPVPIDHDRFGWSIAGAGDVDGDGYDDLVVGAPGREDPTIDSGCAYLYRGGPDGLDAVPAAVIADQQAEGHEQLGVSVAGAGDLDGDGYADLVVGAAGASSGRALVFHGGADGLQRFPAARLAGEPGQGLRDFASAVAGAGDVDGDGRDDLVIGASGTDNGGVFRGSVVLYPGSPAGIVADRALRLDDPDRGEHDHFGHVVAGR